MEGQEVPIIPGAENAQQGAQKPAGAPNDGQQGAGSPPIEKPVLPQLDGDKQPEQPVTPNPSTQEAFVYDSTGDAGLDYALNFVGQQGYGPDHPAMIAAQSGDFSLIHAELAANGVQGADAVLALAQKAYASFQAKHDESAAKLQAVAESAAGGKENWNVVRAWASQNATAEEKAAVNQALAQGGFIAEAVIKQLVTLYSQGNTLPKDAASAVKPGATPSAGAPTGPLTAQAYAEAVRVLHSKLGNRMTDSREYAELQAQRLAARQAGY